jgi:muramoyltetrapeptide carboxypeptidase
MIIPSTLKPGNKIGILAPARKINPDEIEAALNAFRSWTIDPILSPNLFSKGHSYLSGTDAERLSDLQGMINNTDIHAIVCARGGYGSTRILDQVDCSPLIRQPKWLIGFSDITAIHLKLLKLGIASIHGIMPILFSKSDSSLSIESLRSVLMSGVYEIQIASSPFNSHGESKGEVVGGNLSLLVDSLGTKTEIDTDDKILIIEEIDEYLYKLDRMMTQLKRAGKLENLKGLIVGHMTDIKDTELPFGQQIEEIILSKIKKDKIPLAFNFPTGHQHPNLSWIQGGNAVFRVDANSVSLRSLNGSQ